MLYIYYSYARKFSISHTTLIDSFLLGIYKICEGDLVNSNKYIVYRIVLFYNKKEYNLIMTYIEAVT